MSARWAQGMQRTDMTNFGSRPPRMLSVWFAVVVVLAIYAEHGKSTRADSKREILQFSSCVKLGAGPDEIRKSFRERGYKTLKLIESSQELWVVTTPFEIFGANWVMRIRFANDRVTGTHFSTAHDAARHPDEAPPDLLEP